MPGPTRSIPRFPSTDFFRLAGGRGRNQHFSLDGGNATNASGLTRPMQMTSLPMEAMQEFRVRLQQLLHVQGASNFGAVLSARSARAIQLGLRLGF